MDKTNFKQAIKFVPLAVVCCLAFYGEICFGGTFSVTDAHKWMLENESTGYFAHAGGTGGAGGRVVYVTHLGNDGPGSLRSYMEDPNTLIVLFEDGVNGTISLTEHIDVESNKTLWGMHRDGSSADVTIHPANTKAAFTINDGNRNVIFRNLKADANFGVNDDAPDWLRVSDSGGTVWVNHVTALGDGTDGMDGFIDYHTGNLTSDWNKIIDWTKVHRIASEDGQLTTATFHHNLFLRNKSRQPRLSEDNTLAHAFNNLIKDWTGHGMQSFNGGQLLAENNIFIAGDDDDAIIGDGWAGTGNVIVGDAEFDPQSTGIFTPPYAYTLDPIGTVVERIAFQNYLEAETGWQDFAEFAIPEPASWLLLVIGFLFLERGRR